VKKKSSRKARRSARSTALRVPARKLVATEEVPDDDPSVPIKGLRVLNNPDGSFTVSSAQHVVTLSAPGDQPKKYGRRGGIVVAGIVGGTRLPEGTIPVRDADDLEDKLKSAVLATVGTAGYAAPKELHFSLKGLHTLDVGKLSAIIGGQSSPISAHIHLASGDDNPTIPIGG